jgi:hypothetical protein
VLVSTQSRRDAETAIDVDAGRSVTRAIVLIAFQIAAFVVFVASC